MQFLDIQGLRQLWNKITTSFLPLSGATIRYSTQDGKPDITIQPQKAFAIINLHDGFDSIIYQMVLSPHQAIEIVLFAFSFLSYSFLKIFIFFGSNMT